MLLHLITLISNLALFHRLSTATHSMAELHRTGWIVVVAVVGAVLISLLAKWAPVIRGHGIPEAMEAVMVRQSRVAPRTAIAKPISAAIAIGSGAPFGAEGPIIVTGGSIGSLIGQIIPVSPSERKILLAAGAAAGMSATFGAPLAAVVLAIELLLFEFSVRAFVPLVVASSVAGGMHVALIGKGPLFKVPANDFAGLGVLPAFMLLGVGCGVLAIVISRGLFFIESVYRRLPVHEFWHPAIGAVGFAVIGLFVPRVLGVGYDVIGDLLAARIAVRTAAVIAIAKLGAWWLALGSGTSGGTLAPVLMISAAFGLVFGTGLNHVLPGSDVAVGAFAVVAMAATFGAATQATFTAMVFVFELTRDYDVVLPMMLATVIADLIYSAVNDESLMTEKLRRRGLNVTRHYGVDPFTRTRVSEIMTVDVVTLGADASLADARARFVTVGHGAYPIVDDSGRLVAIITRGDVLDDEREDGAMALEVASADVVTVASRAHAQDVLRIMLDESVEHVPVVDDGRLVGIVTRADLLKVRRRQLDLETREPGAIGRRAVASRRGRVHQRDGR